MDVDKLRGCFEIAFAQATAHVRSGDPDPAEFSATALETRRFHGVDCEVELNYSLKVEQAEGAERPVTQMLMVSISPIAGGRAYAQEQAGVESNWVGAPERLDYEAEGPATLSRAVASLTTDEAFQAAMALAEAEELRGLIKRGRAGVKASL
ncbi:MAG: hypothetical protein ACO1PB_04635 [Ramlibacter sp.]